MGKRGVGCNLIPILIVNVESIDVRALRFVHRLQDSHSAEGAADTRGGHPAGMDPAPPW